jgi:hypothetical protein
MIAFSLLGRRNASLSQILDEYPCGNSCENLHYLISGKICVTNYLLKRFLVSD